jgi:hypothetical protein
VTTGGLHPDDEALLQRLGRIAREVDPVPELVLEAGRAAFLLRRLDAELAELVADSLADVRGDPVGVRGGSGRLLSFEAGDSLLELEVTEQHGSAHLVGQVVGVPLEGARLVVETAAGEQDVEVDATGTFRTDVAAGRFRLHLTAPGRTPITTAWVV